MPDIKFINSPRTEEDRLKMTRRVIASGFYQRHGFLVLEGVERKDPSAVVVYPRQFRYKPVGTGLKEGEWGQIETEFWEELTRFFPGSSKLFTTVEVRMTRYGTVSSSASLATPNLKKSIYYLRIDADISDLAAMIINSILYLERKNLGITWSKREALMDFIMTRPTMRRLFPKFRPMMSQLARLSAKARKESEQYVRELGIVSHHRDLEVVNGKVEVKGKLISKELSKHEKKVLGCLIEKSGELVTYDQLADLVWGAGEFKTYWALNKLVERMRDKLTKLGIDPSRIEPVRGQGYLLK